MLSKDDELFKFISKLGVKIWEEGVVKKLALAFFAFFLAASPARRAMCTFFPPHR